MRKPKNRIERVEFLIKKQGHDLTVNLVASMTDSELKKYFNRIYPIYKNQDDYVKPQSKLPTCLICESETLVSWDCSCGHAIIDEYDTALQELKDTGEYERLRILYK